MPPRDTMRIRSPETLRNLRILAGLTQEDLAHAAVKAEGGPLKRQAIGALEAGTPGTAPHATAASICAALGVALDVLWEPRIPLPRRMPSTINS